uniref:Uncharacterized protein n=1 Tax=Arundo donax TaxID=35708 RepID=A0A0A9E1R7_ARUDO
MITAIFSRFHREKKLKAIQHIPFPFLCSDFIRLSCYSGTRFQIQSWSLCCPAFSICPCHSCFSCRHILMHIMNNLNLHHIRSHVYLLLLFNIGRRWFRILDWLGPRKQLQLGSLWHLPYYPLRYSAFMRCGPHWCRAPLYPTVQLSHPNRPWPLHLRQGHRSLQRRGGHYRRRRRGLRRREPSPGDHLLHGARLGDACRRPDLAAGPGGGGAHRGRGRSGLPPRAPGVPGPGSGGRRHRGGRERRGRRRRAAWRGGLKRGALVLVEVAADADRAGK